ncbi:MAG: hypothetical protein EAX90_02940 [Candidatus Heimdallarchaeota archaeon]|nr:hypothetical protein [Candidatus Heimdallarchaeota archaeon]
MNYRILVSKIANDKNNKKLGKITRIELMLGKTTKKNIPYALILFLRPLKKDIVLIDAEKLIKFDTQYAWFDITKEEFDSEAKRVTQIRNEQEKYSGQIPQQKMSNQF